MLKVIKKTTTTCSIVDRVPLDGARPNVATPPPMMMTKTLATRSGNQTSRPRPTGSSSSRARVSDSRAAGRPSRPSAHEAQRDPTSTCSETTVAGESGIALSRKATETDRVMGGGLYPFD